MPTQCCGCVSEKKNNMKIHFEMCASETQSAIVLSLKKIMSATRYTVGISKV